MKSVARIVSLVMLIVSVAVAVYAWCGGFRGMYSFPWIFAAGMLILGVLVLLVFRRHLVVWARVLVLLAMILAASVHVIHSMAMKRDVARKEKASLQALLADTVPLPVFIYALNIDDSATPRLSFRGKATILNFWATWCPPCIEEMPLLENFHEAHDKTRVQVIGLTCLWGDVSTEELRGRKLTETEEFVSDHGVTYPILIDTSAVNYDQYFIDSYPSTILIDADGQVVDFGIGVDGTRRVLDRAGALLAGT